ncbi:Crp/Fnr family transcriptional regulator [Sulfurimonas sp. HSL1-2]|uniref:Crp/Fnr family transcriptional regulator n=1 Tax=Thiomicrolovo zhangzhouensis TaxID=3131933 RepID=UPI0031F75BA9
MNPLRSLPLFEDLNEETFSKLTEIARQCRFRKGEILFFEGDAPNDLVVLTKGILKLFKTSSSDKEIILHHFTPVSLVAEVAVLHRIPYPATAVFEADSEVLLINYDAFESMFLSNQELARVLLLSLSKKIRMLESVIERGLVMDASERVINFIRKSPELLKTMRHYEIANILNLTPETFSRTLKKLQHEGKVVNSVEGWEVLP